MRIRDAITKPVLLAGVGALALGTITAIAVVGTSEPARDSFGCRLPAVHRVVEQPTPPPPPRIVDPQPLPQIST